MFQAPIQVRGHVHVEFKAGRLDWDGRMVTADKRKGKVVLVTSEDDQLMHFQWHDREKNEVALDLIVINDAYFEQIDKCKDGRVYLLRFTSSDKKHFFWMQEPKDDNDADLIKRFNENVGAKIIDSGATAPASGGAAANAGAVAAAAAGMPQEELRAILQQFLETQGAQERIPPIPLSAVLTTDILQGLLTDEAACAEMMGLLPETHRTPEGLRTALGSPQLQQNLGGLTQAVHSDQLPVLLGALNLNVGSLAAAAPGSDALEVLCRIMETQFGEGSSDNNEGGAAPAENNASEDPNILDGVP
mmetsp:Transcript_90150/g.173475  ORF Transcript_90150/g.173475 Transcript_90150/m.173475 type:complete len:303 (-) Transcript_90150:35-943(-)